VLLFIIAIVATGILIADFVLVPITILTKVAIARLSTIQTLDGATTVGSAQFVKGGDQFGRLTCTRNAQMIIMILVFKLRKTTQRIKDDILKPDNDLGGLFY